MQEWLNWPLSKSGVPQGTEGSNPSLSAKKLSEKQVTGLAFLFLYVIVCIELTPSHGAHDPKGIPDAKRHREHRRAGQHGHQRGVHPSLRDVASAGGRDARQRDAAKRQGVDRWPRPHLPGGRLLVHRRLQDDGDADGGPYPSPRGKQHAQHQAQPLRPGLHQPQRRPAGPRPAGHQLTGGRQARRSSAGAQAAEERRRAVPRK